MNKQVPVADKVLHYYYAALAGDMTRKEMEAEVRRILSQTQPCNIAEDGVCEALECPRADDTALLRQALEALESKYIVNCGAWRVQQDAAIAALRQRLELSPPR